MSDNNNSGSGGSCLKILIIGLLVICAFPAPIINIRSIKSTQLRQLCYH